MHKEFDETLLLSESKFIRQREYWVNKLSNNVEKTTFLFDYKRSQHTGKNLEHLEILIIDPLYHKLMKLSKNSDLSLYMVLLAALTSLIHRYTGCEDITVISPIFIYSISEDTINDLVFIRNSIDSEMTFIELLLTVRQSVLKAYENQDYPSEKLLNYLFKSGQNQYCNPISDILCLLENIHDDDIIEKTKAKLIFSFIREKNHIKVDILYHPDIYDKYPLEQASRNFIAVLEASTQEVNIKISDILFLSELEKRQLLLEFNNTAVEYRKDKVVHELFQEQVGKTPENVAVVYGDKQITYRVLNEKANQLARGLRKCGVKSDSIISIMLPPSLEMIIGILGILKGGGAYLPLDPGLPQERIRFMLEESSAPMLLTDSSIISKHHYTTLKNLRSIRLIPRLTAPRPQVKHFDDLPFPDRSLVNYETYANHIGQTTAKNCLSLQATRGCPYNCAYCHKIWPKTHVYRSAENIFQELQLYYNSGIRKFSFIDDIFNLNIKNSRKFFELLIGSELDIQLFFPAGLRGDILTKEYIDLMLKAGTISLAMALETASPRLQKLIGKKLNIEKFRENLEYICEKYPNVIVELFTMHGFPTETKEETLMTFDFIKSLRWVHFSYPGILRIYTNTDMEKIALKSGISQDAIYRSEDLSYEEVSYTLPFEKSFMIECQTDFLNSYFLLKKRLLHILPYQLKVLTREEMVEKYNSYLPKEINNFNELLEFLDVREDELGVKDYLDEETNRVPNLNEMLKKCFPKELPVKNALRILLLDLSQFFSNEAQMLYDVIEAPLGLMSLMAYLNSQFGARIRGKIAKSRIDFDNYRELKVLIEEFKPDVIGIRTLTFYRDFFHKTVAVIRQWGISAPIIAGGPYATSQYASILQDRNIDLVVLGEGELTFAHLIEKFLHNGGKLPEESILDEINGIAFLPEKEKIKHEFAIEVMILDELSDIFTRQSTDNLELVHQLKDLAYVIFTSGSTGNPKGVMIEHQNLIAYLNAFLQEFKVTSKDTVLQQASCSFDAFIEEIYPVLIRGGKLAIPPRKIVLDIDLLSQLLAKHNVTIISCSPLLLNELNKQNLKNGMRVHTFISGGDVLKREYIDGLLNLGDVYNTYGPTETTVCAAYYKCSAGDPSNIPIGKPISNYKIYILDKRNSLLPPGIPGELCISGPGVARGYLGNQGLNDEKFVPNPFVEGERIYKSGDLAKWLPNGILKFLGRIDQQVKIRGYRIELGEIENQLLAYDKIKDAVVILKEDEDGDKYLCAYIVLAVPSPSQPSPLPLLVDVSELKEYLSYRLPEYMIPSYFVPLEKIPLTPGEKVDKGALPVPEAGVPEENFASPGNKVEKKLTEIWSEILKIDKDLISIDSNFFELGGHSLKVTILAARVSRDFNVKMPLVDVFKNPTIRGLSRYISKAKEGKFTSVQVTEKKEYYALSPSQNQLYILQYSNPRIIAYNLSQIVVLEDETDKERLEAAFGKLIQRHESLRTSFVIIKDQPVQKIHIDVEFAIDYHDAQRKSQSVKSEAQGKDTKEGRREPAAMLHASTIKDFIRPFDLSRPPLLRVRLKKVGKAQYILMIDMHHIISDAVSHSILKTDFMSFYAGAGKELPALRLHYKDYAQWQNRKEQKDIMKQQEEYWIKLFAGELPVLNIPTDYPRPAALSFAGDRIEFEIGGKLTQKLKSLTSEQGATIHMVMLAIFNILLARLTMQEDIIIGITTAGRRHADLENTIGFFANTLALRNFPTKEKTFLEFLKEVKENSLEAYENQDYPFECLVNALRVNRESGRNPLFDIIFEIQNDPDPLEEIAGNSITNLTWKPYPFKRNITVFDMIWTGTDKGEHIFFAVDYRTRLFEKESVEIMIERYLVLIESALNNVGSKIKELEYRTDLERELNREMDIRFKF
jgi:amino acid adenylation domain-containing protein